MFHHLLSKVVPVVFNWAPCDEGVLEEWRYSSMHLDLGIRWRCVVSFTPSGLYPQEKSPWYPLDRRLDGLQNVWTWWWREKLSAPVRTWTPNIQLIAQCYTTELSWLLLLYFLRSFNWFLHIHACKKPQISLFLSVPVSAVVERTWLRHTSFQNVWLKWLHMSHKKFVSLQPSHPILSFCTISHTSATR
jgi:hypothetical protein